MNDPRIWGEAVLLACISANDAAGVRRVLSTSMVATECLSLQVKPTYNNAADSSALFHPVASFGLACELGDTLEAIASRNGMHQAAEALQHASQEAQLTKKRIETEAALLIAVANDDGEMVQAALKDGVPVADFLALRVQKTFNNASDRSAFFHSIASFGLTFEIGDTIEDLADRNGRINAGRAMQRYTRRARSPRGSSWGEQYASQRARSGRVHVVMRSVAGDVFAEIDADRDWTIGQLAFEVGASGAGCLVFVSGDLLLTPEIVIADLCHGGDTLELSVSVNDGAPGCYRVQLQPSHPQTNRGDLAPRASSIPSIHISLHLEEDGTAILTSERKTAGHLAPISRGLHLVATGHWSFAAPGIVISFAEYKTPSDLNGDDVDVQLSMFMPREGELELLQVDGEEANLFRRAVPLGTVLKKTALDSSASSST